MALARRETEKPAGGEDMEAPRSGRVAICFLKTFGSKGKARTEMGWQLRSSAGGRWQAGGFCGRGARAVFLNRWGGAGLKSKGAREERGAFQESRARPSGGEEVEGLGAEVLVWGRVGLAPAR